MLQEKKVSFLVSRMGVWASPWQCIMGFVPEQTLWTSLMLQGSRTESHHNITHCTHKSHTLIKSLSMNESWKRRKKKRGQGHENRSQRQNFKSWSTTAKVLWQNALQTRKIKLGLQKTAVYFSYSAALGRDNWFLLIAAYALKSLVHHCTVYQHILKHSLTKIKTHFRVRDVSEGN